MTTRLNPYISFDGNAREAMEFYREALGGDLRVSTFGEYGPADAPHADKVMHAMLEAPDGLTLMAADTPPGMTYDPGTNISISLSGEDADRLRGWFARLSDGGQVTVPMEKQIWGDEFGMFVDRFGILWVVNVNATPL